MSMYKYLYSPNEYQTNSMLNIMTTTSVRLLESLGHNPKVRAGDSLVSTLRILVIGYVLFDTNVRSTYPFSYFIVCTSFNN